jgi:predicted nucleotidyltransferase
MSESPVFDWTRALIAMSDRGVRFIVIGGVAARVLGSPSLTSDLDVCYARDRANVESLASVLIGIRARLRGAKEDVPFLLDAKTLLAGDSFAFETDLGDLDIVATPSGTRGYDDLVLDAQAVEIDGRKVLVASIDDLIRMKLATGRLKDRIGAEVLGALREELGAHG